MANNLDEMNSEILNEGHDIHVIAKQLAVKVGLLDYMVIFIIPIFAILTIIIGIIFKDVLGILIGVALLYFIITKYKNTNAYFDQLEQKVQHHASQLDNYLENRVVILENAARLLDKAISLDKELLSNIAKYRSGLSTNDRNEINSNLDNMSKEISLVFENYPDIKSHSEIRDVLQQNAYLQKEITAARELYNDVVFTWNRDIFGWPFKRFVAAKRGATTRIPFIATKEIKDKAKSVFF